LNRIINDENNFYILRKFKDKPLEGIEILKIPFTKFENL
jgi:hypothetical protein